MRQGFDIDGWGAAPVAVALLRTTHSGAMLPALLAQLDPRAVSVVFWGADLGPAKEAESFDIIRRAGFNPEPCTDGVRLEAGTLYLVPADRRVWFQGPRLRVGASSPHERPSLDRVLQSLARAWGRRSIVIAPEPLGADGERGMHAVRLAGGDVRMALVSRPEAASPSNQPSEAEREREPPASRTAPRSQRPAAPAFRVQRMFPCSALVVHRMQAAATLAVQRAAARDRVRAWVPACKTGGLAYAVAMLLHEAVERVGLGQRVQVFGTDPDEEALAVARAGRYPLGIAEGVDPTLRARYLRDAAQGEGGGVIASEALREACFFSSHKLPRHAPFSRIDLLVCQRVFEGVPPSQRDDVVSELSCSLRDEGVLFALDHRQYFQNGCFELQPAGHLQPRPVRVWARPWPVARERARADAEPVVGAGSEEPAPALSRSRQTPRRPGQPSLAPRPDELELQLLVEAIGLPLVLLDDQLRVLHVSDAALRRFGLSADARRSTLDAIAPRLPGRRELLQAAERALDTGATSELALGSGARTYLVRVSVGQRATGRRLALLFTDVSALEAVTDRALLHRHQQAGVARLGELALGTCPLATLYEEALGTLIADIPVGRAGVIVECRSDVPPLAVVASHGLGPDPLGVLRGAGAPFELIQRVVERSSGGEPLQRVEVWSAGTAEALRSLEGSAWPSGMASPPIEGGAAWPIVGEKGLLGVIALYSSRGDIDAAEHQRFVQSIANVLATASARDRARQRLELERAVDAVIASAGDLATLGRGLAQALRSALAGESLEIWCATPEPAPVWQQHFPELSPATVAPPWPAELFERGRPLYRAELGSERPSELWLVVPTRTGAAAVLRASGLALRAPHSEIEAGLEAITRRLVPFFDRLRAQSDVRFSETARRRALPELEALFESLPIGISVHDSSGAVRHGLHFTHEPWLARLYAEELPVWLARSIETGEPIHQLELSVVAGAERRSWLCSIRPLRDDDGAPSGAIVVVHDPADSRSSADPPSQPPRPESSIESRRLRVAILSADVDDTSALAVLLEAEGYAVELATLEGAARESSREPPDLILYDIDSVSVDLVGLTEQIRAVPGAGRLGLVALSRDDGALTRLRVEEAGFDDQLTLPVTSETLTKCLARLSAAPARQHRRG